MLLVGNCGEVILKKIGKRSECGMLGILSDKGNIRPNNEDFVGFFETEVYKIYVVADGMGGYNSGEVASKIAVEKTMEYIDKNIDKLDPKELVKAAVKNANKEILTVATENKSCKGMGTTITCCFIKNNEMVVGHVGDSSCYILRQNEINKLTKDHSLVQELLDSGSITEEEAANHPNKNIITRALGTSAEVEIDVYMIKINDINKIMLCTDGLSNFVSEKEMLQIISNYDNDESARKLIQLGKEKGSRDNLSIIVFEGEGIK